MKRIVFALLVVLIAGCGPDHRGADDNDTKIITLPSHESVQVMFDKPGSFICKGVRESLREINNQVVEPKQYSHGFMYLDVVNSISNYRAYFIRPANSHLVTAFVMCSGAGAPLDGKFCAIQGFGSDRCFETANLDWPAGPGEIRAILLRAEVSPRRGE